MTIAISVHNIFSMSHFCIIVQLGGNEKTSEHRFAVPLLLDFS